LRRRDLVKPECHRASLGCPARNVP
jgi:hypothetical protein